MFFLLYSHTNVSCSTRAGFSRPNDPGQPTSHHPRESDMDWKGTLTASSGRVYYNQITAAGIEYLGGLWTGDAPAGEKFEVLRLYDSEQTAWADRTVSFSYTTGTDELTVTGSAVWESGVTAFDPIYIALRTSEGREIAIADISAEGLLAGDPVAFTRRDVVTVNPA